VGYVNEAAAGAEFFHLDHVQRGVHKLVTGVGACRVRDLDRDPALADRVSDGVDGNSGGVRTRFEAPLSPADEN
jgi:hypothetical protein